MTAPRLMRPTTPILLTFILNPEREGNDRDTVQKMQNPFENSQRASSQFQGVWFVNDPKTEHRPHGRGENTTLRAFFQEHNGKILHGSVDLEGLKHGTILNMVFRI